jgi:hypothetical protein
MPQRRRSVFRRQSRYNAPRLKTHGWKQAMQHGKADTAGDTGEGTGRSARQAGNRPLRRGPRLPPMFLALSFAASVFIAVGIIGLAAPEALPTDIGSSAAAGMLIAGVALKTWAVSRLIAAIRAAGRG